MGKIDAKCGVKKIVLIIIFGIFLFLAYGCGGGDSSSNSTPEIGSGNEFEKATFENAKFE